jgi:acyl-CoA reductase-like NAD-dependent aldehyde dehydrogenase
VQAPEPALGELRAVGAVLRARSLDSRVDAIGRVLERFRDPAGDARRELEAALPDAAGFAKETVRAGLALALEPFSADALAAVARRELGGWGEKRRFSGFPVTSVLLGGALPMPTLVALATPLVLGSPVLARVSSHDPVTAACFARALAREDEDLAAALRVTSFPSDDDDAMAAFLSADCVVAYGSDATMRAVAARTTPRQRLVRHGHRVSVAVLGDRAAQGGAATAFARDVSLWDQQGCLSPLALYLLGHERVPEELLDRLADALREAATDLPPGRLPPGAAAIRASERETLRVRAAADGTVSMREGAGFTLVAEPDARFRGSPLHRFVRVHPVPDPEALLTALAPLAPHLASVGWAGLGAESALLARELPSIGVSRICPLGCMQAPPLGWCHDQEGVLLPLARLSDVEGQLAPAG